MVVGDPNAVAGIPTIVKRPIEHAGQTLPGECRHVVVGHDLPFADSHGVYGFAVRPRSRRNVQQRHRLVQVEHHGRMPVKIRFENTLCNGLRHLQSVAIVVVVHIFTPIWWRGRHSVLKIFAFFGVTVVPIHHFIPAVGLRHRVDNDDDVIPNGLYFFSLARYQAVRQFHEHFGGAGFGSVHSAVQEIHHFAVAHNFLYVGGVYFARVSEECQLFFVVVEPLDGGGIGNDGHLNGTIFFGCPDLFRHDVGRRLGQFLKIPVNLRRMVQCPRRTDDLPKLFQRRWNLRVTDQIQHRRRQKARVSGGFLDFLVVGFVNLLGLK